MRYIKQIGANIWVKNATEPYEQHPSVASGLYEVLDVDGEPDPSWEAINYVEPKDNPLEAFVETLSEEQKQALLEALQ